MHEPLLSILIPVHNKEEFIPAILDRVLDAPLPRISESPPERELIIVDDASTDGSSQAIQEYIKRRPNPPIQFFRHSQKRGRGAAIRTALEHASGEYSIIQDASLAYHPREYSTILRPLMSGEADVVYGSRFLRTGEHRIQHFRQGLTSKMLTALCNLATDLDFTDMETGYKAFRTQLARSIPLSSESFGIDPELTIKFAKREARMYEVPIRYCGESHDERKIHPDNVFRALASVVRFSASGKVYKDHGPDILDTLSKADRFNQWMADTVSPYLGDEVLELGAGMGNLSRHLAGRRRRYIATDIDLEHIARLRARLAHRPNVETAMCDLTKPSDFEPWRGELDSVVCLNVLEHTEDDVVGLENLYSCLRPGGRAIVLVPQGASVYGTLDKVLGHFRRYSKSELENKMKAVGFRVDRVLEFNRVTYPGWYLNGRVLKREHFSRLQLGIFDRLVWLWRRIDSMLPWPPTSIIGIGVRG